MESPSASSAFGSRFDSLGLFPEQKFTFSLVFYFRQVPLLSDARITDILEVGWCTIYLFPIFYWDLLDALQMPR